MIQYDFDSTYVKKPWCCRNVKHYFKPTEVFQWVLSRHLQYNKNHVDIWGGDAHMECYPLMPEFDLPKKSFWKHKIESKFSWGHSKVNILQKCRTKVRFHQNCTWFPSSEFFQMRLPIVIQKLIPRNDPPLNSMKWSGNSPPPLLVDRKEQEWIWSAILKFWKFTHRFEFIIISGNL